MKQQEVNQFSEGINLDMHPIALNNLLLSGALNATTITMNGNELILLNDMGNGKVEMANLPAGYVPVGMLEFGGIVYVASYNPLTNQSLIGSFPSPERNISSNESNDGREIVFKTFSNEDVINTVVLKVQLTTDVIRPGDKFSIQMDNVTEFEKLLNLIHQNIMKLSVCTMDSNGSLIDITLQITASYKYLLNNEIIESFIYCSKYPNEEGLFYTLDDILFNIHKNKVVGELYLKLQLVIPNTLSYYISGEKCDNNSKKFKIYFNNVDNISKYKLKIIRDYDLFTEYVEIDVNTAPKEDDLIYYLSDEISKFTYKDSDNNTLDVTYTCEITPYFNGLSEDNSGWLNSYTYTVQININKIATGDIEVNEFRYYNNTDDNIFIFNYTLTSYLKATQHISKIYLCTINKKDITSNKLYIPYKTLISENGMYYGNVQNSLRYTNIDENPEIPSLDKGLFYIGYLEIIVEETNKAASYVYSKPFFIITSSITNYLYTGGLKNYVNGDDSNNYPYLTNLLYDDYLALPCHITWNIDLIENNLESTINSTGFYLPTDSNKPYITHEYKQTGNCKFKINPKITTRLKSDNPFLGEIEAYFDKFEILNETDSVKPTIKYDVEINGTLGYNLLTSNTYFNNSIDLSNERVLNESEYYFDNNIITIDLNSNPIYSRFIADKKLVDEDRSGLIILPYINTDSERQRVCGLLFIQEYNGDEVLFNSANAYLAIWHDRKSDGGSHKYCKLFFVLADADTANMIPWNRKKYDSDEWHIPGWNEREKVDEATNIFLIKSLKKSSIPWKSIVSYLKDFLETGLPKDKTTPYLNFDTYDSEILPTLLFMLAADTEWDFGFRQDLFNAGYTDGTYDYCIPLLMGTDGLYYPLNDFGHAASTNNESQKGYLDKLLKVFLNVCIASKELQTYHINLYVASDLNYLYTKSSIYNYSFNVKGTTKVKVTNYDDSVIYNITPKEAGADITIGNEGNLKLPKLTLIDEYNNIKPYDYATLVCPINNINIELDALLFIAYGNNSMTNLFVIYDTTKQEDSIKIMDGNGRPFNLNYPYFRGNDGEFYAADIFSNKSNENKDLIRIANYFKNNILKVDILQYNPDYCIYINLKKASEIKDRVVKINGKRKDSYGYGSDSWSLTNDAGMPFLDVLFVNQCNFTQK